MAILTVDTDEDGVREYIVNLDSDNQPKFMPKQKQFLEAEEAAATLGISRATLYAYVSRGLIRGTQSADDPRRRLYSVHDIAQLKKRKTVGRRPRDVAAATLHGGLPVLTSEITLIEDGHFFYRGHDAVRWAESASLEETARLLWSCGDNDPFEASTGRASPWDRDTLKLVSDLPLTERCQILLPLMPLARAIAWQRDDRRLWPGAATLLRIIAAAASATQPTLLPIHAHLARTWDLNKIAADIVRRVLVLLADHELNASAFAVRVVASTGASLGACLNAGLSAMSGPLHGGTTSLVEALLEEVDQSGNAATVVEKRLRRGDGVPGFDHRLYPDGDPRAAALLPILPKDASRTALLDVMADTAGKLPHIDFALVSIRRAFKLPAGSALALFAIGRTVGWIAHALEQRNEEKLIRPRARYTGPSPKVNNHTHQ